MGSPRPSRYALGSQGFSPYRGSAPDPLRLARPPTARLRPRLRPRHRRPGEAQPSQNRAPSHGSVPQLRRAIAAVIPTLRRFRPPSFPVFKNRARYADKPVMKADFRQMVHQSPPSFAPLLEMGALGTQRGVITMTGVDNRLVAEPVEDPRLDILEQGFELRRFR